MLTGLAAVLVLSACAVPSIRTDGDTEALDVRAVAVDASGVRLEGRQYSVSQSELRSDFETALSAALATGSVAGATPVRVDVTLTGLRLAPPPERIAGATSTATGIVRVTETGSDRVIVPSTEVTGNSENFRAVLGLGLVTTPGIDKDYSGTVNGFADTVRQTLFGSDT